MTLYRSQRKRWPSRWHQEWMCRRSQLSLHLQPLRPGVPAALCHRDAGGPAAPTPGLSGEPALPRTPRLCVKHSQAHGDFPELKASKAPGREIVFRLSLTHTFLFISHPGSTELCCEGQVLPRGHSQIGHREAVRGSTKPPAQGQPHFLAPALPSLGQTSHSSPLPVFLCFYPRVVAITGQKRSPGAGRISTSCAFRMCWDLPELHSKVRSAQSSVSPSAATPGENSSRPQQSLGQGCHRLLQPLHPETCFLKAASIYLHCQVHLAVGQIPACKTEGPLFHRLAAPQVWGSAQAFVLIFPSTLQSTGSLYRDLNLIHFLQSTEEKSHSLAGSCAPASSMSGVKRTLSSVVQMESPSPCHLDTAPALYAP